MSWACHHCGRGVDKVERVGRRDACLGCGSDLHCCCNCRFYTPGRDNDCREPQAERQVDKQRGNFCEYFSFAEMGRAAAAPPDASRARLEALFAGRKRS